jgi:hypothetical protein
MKKLTCFILCLILACATVPNPEVESNSITQSVSQVRTINEPIPGFLSFVQYALPLAIHNADSIALAIDYGQSLVDSNSYKNGKNGYQIYYLLCQDTIPPNTSKIIYGVCGGSGSSLSPGTLVIPCFRTSERTSEEIGTIIRLIELNYNQAKINNDSDKMEIVKTLCVHLRNAIINSVNNELRQAFLFSTSQS